jgi:hypothetical protein
MDVEVEVGHSFLVLINVNGLSGTFFAIMCVCVCVCVCVAK